MNDAKAASAHGTSKSNDVPPPVPQMHKHWLVLTRLSFGALTWIFEAISALLKLPQKLAEHAAVGWINEEIGEHLGISRATFDDFILLWAPSAFAAAICLSGWICAIYLLRARPSSASTAVNAMQDDPPPVGEASVIATVRSKSPTTLERVTLDRIKRLNSRGKSLLSVWSFVHDRDTRARAQFIGWLTEAEQIISVLSKDEWNAYATQLRKEIGHELSQGDLYKKAQNVCEIMTNLLEVAQMVPIESMQ
jgi:hypothetical protein